MPRVSLPAAPASRRKQYDHATYFFGSSASASTSSEWNDVTGTSAVPARNKSSFSQW